MRKLSEEAAAAYFFAKPQNGLLWQKCRSLLKAYGASRPYLQLYQVGDVGVLALFEDKALVQLGGAPPEEIGAFLNMLSGRWQLTAEEGDGALLLPFLKGEIFPRCHQVFVEKKASGERVPQLIENASPKECHQLFQRRFAEDVGAFDAFYCDYFYRHQKGLSQLFAWCEAGEIVGALLATDVEEGAAGISTVAVEKAWEGKGIARKLLEGTVQRLAPREVWCISKGPEVDGLYRKLGFTPRERILTVTLGGTE